jgi:hypothetical protein
MRLSKRRSVESRHHQHRKGKQNAVTTAPFRVEWQLIELDKASKSDPSTDPASVEGRLAS